MIINALIMRNIITLPEYNMPDMEENAVYPAMNSTHLYFVMTIMTIAAILAIAGKMQNEMKIFSFYTIFINDIIYSNKFYRSFPSIFSRYISHKVR